MHNQILVADGLAGEIALENFARAGCIAGLRRERRARDVRGHPVMRHRPPRMVLRRRLREPDVTGISGELAALKSANNGIAVAYLATRGVHDVGAALHLPDEFVVEHMLGFGMQRAVDRNDIANPDH